MGHSEVSWYSFPLAAFLNWIISLASVWILILVVERLLIPNFRPSDFGLPELNTYTPNPEIDKNRASKTFIASLTSMQLMLYNVYFLENIGRPKGKSLKDVADGYDALYGHATNIMKEKFLECITDVRAIKDYKYL